MNAFITKLLCIILGFWMYFSGKDGGPFIAAYFVISALKGGEE